MNEQVFIGHTTHKRIHPVKHSFRYPLYVMDLDIFSTKKNYGPLFSKNKFNIFSLFDNDYLIKSNHPLKEKVDHVLSRFSFTKPYDELRLLTTPRFLKKTFNPVSFYYAYNKHSLTFIIAEVTNTFQEKHLYLLDVAKAKRKKGYYIFTKPKNFYISPFSENDGELTLFLTDIKQSLDIFISYSNKNKKEVTATLTGEAQPMSTKNLLYLALSYPLSAAKTMPRILWQAGILHYLKKHKARRKPMATHDHTLVKEKETKSSRRYLHYIHSLFEQIEGSIQIQTPDGNITQYGKANSEPLALNIHSYNFFEQVIRSADIGLVESYLANEWSCNNLTKLYELLIDNQSIFKSISLKKSAAQSYYKLKHKLRHNSLRNSKANIAEHYDLGNDFYSLFLDPSMSYSCAYFNQKDQSLAEAQQNKIQKIIDKLQIEPHHNVLEIGSGWGSLGITIAKQSGCSVTGLTLSKEQLLYAEKQSKTEAVDHLVDFKLEDYREHVGKYDRIVSIEMIEAVGYDYLETYLHTIHTLLKKDGLAVIQGITFPDQLYERYRKKTDFIQQYIFPGGHLPSLSHITELLTSKTDLMIDNIENIGQHYALTLNKWSTSFQENKDKIIQLYDERFFKIWEHYFAYCEAAFAKRYIHTLQIVLSKNKNEFLINRFNQELN